jgi:hypothetical protein
MFSQPFGKCPTLLSTGSIYKYLYVFIKLFTYSFILFILIKYLKGAKKLKEITRLKCYLLLNHTLLNLIEKVIVLPFFNSKTEEFHCCRIKLMIKAELLLLVTKKGSDKCNLAFSRELPNIGINK